MESPIDAPISHSTYCTPQVSGNPLIEHSKHSIEEAGLLLKVKVRPRLRML